MKNPIRSLFILLLFLTAFQTVSGQESEKKLSWIVGVFSFDTKGAGNSLILLKNTIPRALLNALNDIPHHLLNSDEQLGWIRRDYKKAITLKEKELSALYEKKSKLLFSDSNTNVNQVQYLEKIEEKKNEISSLKENTSLFSHTSTLPVVLYKGNKNGLLADFTGSSEDNIIYKKEIDQAIYGKLEMIDQWLYLSVYIYNYLTHRKETLYKNIINPEEVHKVIPEIISAVRLKVTGRKPAILTVKGSPSDAFYSLDGGQVHLTGVPVSTFLPGSYKLKIYRNGYSPKQYSVVLKSGEEKEVLFNLEKLKTGFISLSTFPNNADIYTGSLWLGKSPVIVKNPVFPEYITIKKDGYIPYTTILDKTLPDRNVKIFLSSDKINPDRMMDNRRRKFYNSFAAFVVSLLVPVISYGLSSDYGYAYNNIITTDPFGEEAQRLMNSSTLWYNLYLGGTFISSALFINMAVDLQDYIKLYNEH